MGRHFHVAVKGRQNYGAKTFTNHLPPSRPQPCVKLRGLLVPLYPFLGAVRMQIASRLWLVATLIVVPFTFAAHTVAAQQAPVAQRPITIDDLLQIREVEGPRLSPDAQW